jgi:hypothetical protein
MNPASKICPFYFYSAIAFLLSATVHADSCQSSGISRRLAKISFGQIGFTQIGAD